MECTRLRAILFEHSDTEIPGEIRDGVEAHLARCVSCASWFEALGDQLGALRALPKMKAPADFLDSLHKRIESPSLFRKIERKAASLFAWNRLVRLTGAAVATALVIISIRVAMKEIDSPRTFSRMPSPSAQAPAPAPPFPARASSAQAPASSPPTAMESLAVPKESIQEKSVPEKPENRTNAAPPAPEAYSPMRRQAQALRQAETQATQAQETNAREAPALNAGSRKAQTPPSVTLTLKVARSSSAGEEFSLQAPGNRRNILAAPGSSSGDFGSMNGGGSAGSKAAAKSLSAAASGSFGGGVRRERGAESGISSDPGAPLSKIVRLVRDSKGKILSGGAGEHANQPDTLIAEIPAGSYSRFLDGLREMGEIEFTRGADPRLLPDVPVRVTIVSTFTAENPVASAPASAPASADAPAAKSPRPAATERRE